MRWRDLNLDRRPWLFVTTLALTTLALLFSMVVNELAESVLLGVVLVALFALSRVIWRPPDYGKTIVRKYALWVTLAVAVSSQNWWAQVLVELIKRVFGESSMITVGSVEPSPYVLLFVLCVIVVALVTQERSLVPAREPRSRGEFIAEPDFIDLRKSFCEWQVRKLANRDGLDIWSDDYKPPPELEVEVFGIRRRARRITRLSMAVHDNPNRPVFLLIGDAGSGKSFALRRLCQELCSDDQDRGRVPIYLNLAEWQIERKIDEEDPPTQHDFNVFFKESLKDHSGNRTESFLDRYYTKLFESGRLFFVIDSFDEIPLLLNEKDGSRLHKAFSDVVYDAVGLGANSRGLVASRHTRKPAWQHGSHLRLEAHPLSERRIHQLFKWHKGVSARFANRLFLEQPQMAALARNHFTANLIVEFASKREVDPPKTVSELFETFVDRRLEVVSPSLQKAGLEKNRVLDNVTEIAVLMLERSWGFEVGTEVLAEALPDRPILKVLRLLNEMDIGRVDDGPQKRFRFVHRRFVEYFASRAIRDGRKTPDYRVVEEDSAWREPMILFAEVGPEDKAIELAKTCWQVIREKHEGAIADQEEGVSTTDDLRASVLALRFLHQAFHARPQCLEGFRNELAEVVEDNLRPESSLVVAKWSLEGVGLLDQEAIHRVVERALVLDNEWLQNTAIRSCRYLARLSPDLELGLLKVVQLLPIPDLLWRSRELAFGFSLSDSFRSLKRLLWYRVLDAVFFIVGLLLLAIVGLWMFSLQVAAISMVASAPLGKSVKRAVHGVAVYFRISYLILGSIVFIYLASLFLALGKVAPWLAVASLSAPGSIMMLVALMLLFPGSDLLFLFRLGYDNAMVFIARNTIGFFIVAVAAGLVAWAILRSPISFSVGVAGVVTAPVLSYLASVVLVIVFGANLVRCIHDWKAFRGLEVVENMKRSTIERQVGSLWTGFFRYRYARQLHKKRVVASGPWRSRMFPDCRADDAETLIAKLDEGWMELEWAADSGRRSERPAT